jgi:hypothetical protein
MTLTKGRKAAILVGIVIFIIGSSTGVSYALWSITATTSATVAAGSISITANSAVSTTLTALNTAAMGPGSTLTTSVTVTNTSTTLPLAYTTTIANVETPTTGVIGDNIDYTVWVTAAAANCTAAAVVGTPSWTGNLGTNGTLGAGRTIAASASEVLCVRTTMKTTAPSAVQGQSVATTLTFTGSSI